MAYWRMLIIYRLIYCLCVMMISLFWYLMGYATRALLVKTYYLKRQLNLIVINIKYFCPLYTTKN